MIDLDALRKENEERANFLLSDTHPYVPRSRLQRAIQNVDTLIAEVEAYEGMKEGVAIRIADLEAEVERLTRDAARWKWCEENITIEGIVGAACTLDSQNSPTTVCATFAWNGKELVRPFAAVVDAAIERKAVE